MLLLVCVWSRIRRPVQALTLLLYLRQDAKQHCIDEFKRHLAVRFLLYNTSWGVITGRTMEAGSSAQPQRGQRHKGLFEEQKPNFFPFFCPQSLAAAQSGLVGISTFLPNREQGHRVMNQSTAAAQLTPWSPFIPSFLWAPGKDALAPPLSVQRSPCPQKPARLAG